MTDESLPAVSAPAAPNEVGASFTVSHAVALLEHPETLDDFERTLREGAKDLPTDMQDPKARDAVRSYAHKVARTKTFVDDHGKELGEEARKRLNTINDARKVVRDRLDALKEEVRRPLTEWETAEEARKRRVTDTLEAVRAARELKQTDDIGIVEGRIEHWQGHEITPARYGEDLQQVSDEVQITITALNDHLEFLKKQDAERAELERLRKAEEERKAAEEARLEVLAARLEVLERIDFLGKLTGEQTVDELRRNLAGLRAMEVAPDPIPGDVKTMADRWAEAVAKVDNAISELEEQERAEREAAERARIEEEEAERKAAAERQQEQERLEREQKQERQKQSTLHRLGWYAKQIEDLAGAKDEAAVRELLDEAQTQPVGEDLFGAETDLIREAHTAHLRALQKALEQRKAAREEAEAVEARRRDMAHRNAVKLKAQTAIQRLVRREIDDLPLAAEVDDLLPLAAVIDDLMTEAIAERLLLAIMADEVPGVSLAF